MLILTECCAQREDRLQQCLKAGTKNCTSHHAAQPTSHLLYLFDVAAQAQRTRFKVSQDGKGGRSANS
jgi:hypothetical protein